MSQAQSHLDHVAYYDDQYASGYTDAWSTDAQRRVRDFIRGMDLPAVGRAIDFGCGLGTLTPILREALPNWEICGTDISRIALADAARRYPGLRFIPADDATLNTEKFDFLLTHHVLEHVQDLVETWGQMVRLLKPGGDMLHILPCGHAGSLEYRLAALGRPADARPDAPFFYEDPRHLRRARECDLTAVATQFGMRLARARYKDQFWGGLRNLTDNGVRHALRVTRPSIATSTPAALKLMAWRLLLAPLSALRLMPQKAFHRLRGAALSPRNLAATLLAAPLYFPSRVLDEILQRLAESESRFRPTDSRAAEMFLYYTLR